MLRGGWAAGRRSASQRSPIPYPPGRLEDPRSGYCPFPKLVWLSWSGFLWGQAGNSTVLWFLSFFPAGSQRRFSQYSPWKSGGAPGAKTHERGGSIHLNLGPQKFLTLALVGALFQCFVHSCLFSSQILGSSDFLSLPISPVWGMSVSPVTSVLCWL